MDNGDKNQQKESQFKILLWLLAVLVSVNISVVGYVAGSFLGLERRVTTIEANRWTARDGAAVFKEIAGINEKLARLPSEYPPQWMRDFVSENRNRLVRLEEKLSGNK